MWANDNVSGEFSTKTLAEDDVYGELKSKSLVADDVSDVSCDFFTDLVAEADENFAQNLSKAKVCVLDFTVKFWISKWTKSIKLSFSLRAFHILGTSISQSLLLNLGWAFLNAP